MFSIRDKIYNDQNTMTPVNLYKLFIILQRTYILV